MTKKWMYACIPLLVAVAIRLYPYLVSGLPFHQDAWGSIRNTELLLKDTPINLGDSVFDGYNNYWPAISLFGAVVSEVLLLPPIQTMAIFLPLVGATSILIFYALVKRIFNAEIAFVASVIFATAFAHVYVTAGVLKETYANPLYLLLILIFLHPALVTKKKVLLFTVTSVALALTHHLTIVITIVILSGITIARLISNTKRGLAPNKSDFLLTSILIVSATAYFRFYAYAGFNARVPITYSDWMSAGLYQILAFALAMYFMYRPSTHAKTRAIIVGSAAIAIAFIFTLLIMRRPFVPGASAVPEYYLLYNLPYLIVLPFIALGYGYQKQVKASMTLMFWLAAIVGLEAYALFSNSGFLSFALTTRGLGFLLPLIAIFTAAGLHRLNGAATKQNSKKFMKFAVTTTIIVIATLSFYSIYATVSLRERHMGYGGLCHVEEYEAGNWIATNGNKPTVSGDSKVFSLLHSYFDVEVDHIQAFRFLNGETESQPQLLYIYDEMLKNGYLIIYQAVDLPDNWIEKASQMNLIYSNSRVTLYAQTEKGT